jgi:taurine dioxygenase
MNVQELPGVGAEITGVELGNLADNDFQRIREAFNQHGLLFFRDQDIGEEQHIAFAERWGTININRFFAAHDSYPQIALVAKEPDQEANIGGGWHTDHSYDEVPALGSILVARELPACGGDTCFTSMYKAYDALSPGLQDTIGRLQAVHSAQHVFGSGGYVKEAHKADGRIGNAGAADELADPVHPMVITHPLSGRKALYVNPGFTRQIHGWTHEESRPLLEYLYEVACGESLVTRFQWQPGSVAFWDNRATWHMARNDYHGQRRVMHRITIDGCPLVSGVCGLAQEAVHGNQDDGCQGQH